MKRIALAILLIVGLTMSASAQSSTPSQNQPHQWAIVLHGGAGVIERSSMSPEAERQYRAGLNEAITAAGAILDKGGTATDAVEAAIEILEDNPLFNAGRGSVFAADGTNQMDAAIMDGATMKAGAVADVQHTRHPIVLARAVMDKSQNVMMIGAGADAFSVHIGLQQEPQSFFFTEPRWRTLVKELQKENLGPIPPRPAGAPPEPTGQAAFFESPDNHKYGTVGVVALDQQGNIAAGTSTGGLTAKRWDRVGDSPIIGAGTYASNQSCAVSATGTGEYFIRLTVARTICALVQYQHMPLQQAADEVIKQVGNIQGDGGVIAITPDGQQAWAYNTPGMFRAKLKQGGKPQIAIYRDEP